jgi:hypothetical protein
MTDLNTQDRSQGLIAAQAQPSQEIPGNLRQLSTEDMVPQPLTSQGILASPSEADADPDVATSIGASINESMMMPIETLPGNGPDLTQLASIAAGSDEELAPPGLWQKQAKAMDEKIRQNPYAYIAGALGLGLVVGRSLVSGQNRSL